MGHVTLLAKFSVSGANADRRSASKDSEGVLDGSEEDGVRESEGAGGAEGDIAIDGLKQLTVG